MAPAKWDIKIQYGRTRVVHNCSDGEVFMFYSDTCVRCDTKIPLNLLRVRNFQNLSNSEAKEAFLRFRKELNLSLENLI